MFAGLQLAFTDAIRVGDVVVAGDKHETGSVEEITLSYVVVRIWDELEAGNLDRAWEIHEQCAPLLLYEGMYWGPSFYYILKKRGVIKSDKFRSRAFKYKAENYAEMDELLKPVEQFYRV